VQGQLRQDTLSVIVNTECAHCSRPMEIEIDSDLNYTVNKEGFEPIIFVPDVNLFKLEDESIINAF
jgi:hypothetical protein